MNDLIKEIATKHGLEDIKVEEHNQMFGNRLYQVRATDQHGNRHGFDYVPNPQQPRSSKKQKIDQMILSLREMSTPEPSRLQ
jgi:hypothetical protein